jgi:glyoxylate reductase
MSRTATSAPLVYLSRRILDRPTAELQASFTLRHHDSEWPPSREALLAGVRGAEGILVLPTDRVDEELLNAAGRQLRIVANHAVGYDNVDVSTCTEAGVLVTNTPDVLTEATAELTLALMLALTRRVAEGDRLVRGGREWVFAPTFLLGPGLVGRTLGIVGLGRIGHAVARMAEAFGMRVLYTSRRPQPDVSYPRLSLDELLAEADVVSLHCPLTPDTHHLIDAAALARMRPEAVLINTTRGPVVDEAALVEALRAGTIAGAGLDVYEREPEVHPGLLELENVVLTPHIGSATFAAREAMGMLCVDALRAVLLDSRLPANALNPEAVRARATP